MRYVVYVLTLPLWISALLAYVVGVFGATIVHWYRFGRSDAPVLAAWIWNDYS